MEISSSAAIRGYGAARDLMGPAGTAKSAAAKPESKEPNALAKGMESFSDALKNVETTTQSYAAGQSDAQSVVQALANAEMALETAVTVRNRVVEAYQELLRMPI